MISSITKEFRYNIKYIITALAVTLGAFILGDAITYTVMIVAKPDTYCSIGGMLSFVVALISVLTIGITIFGTNFDIAISMGRKRKSYLINASIFVFITQIVNILLAILLGNLSYIIYKAFWGYVPLEKDFTGIISLDMITGHWWQAILIIVGSALFGYCISALIKKFGRNFLWVLWGIYMAVVLFGSSISNIIKKSDTSSALGKFIVTVSSFFSSISFPILPVLGILLLMALAIYSTYIYMTTSVKC